MKDLDVAVVAVVAASPSRTNKELIEIMQAMKKIREDGTAKHVVMLIHGFNDDPRALCDIPEARAFCRRLVSLGFISYLDLSADLFLTDPATQHTLGAAEIWLMGEGRYRIGLVLDVKLLDECMEAYKASNVPADKHCGPFKKK